jgi:hypothetical protein
VIAREGERIWAEEGGEGSEQLVNLRYKYKLSVYST